MIRYDDSNHKYFDGEKELISVTTLLRKHGLAPDYSNVPESVLSKKAERGTIVHAEIEDYIKKGVIGFTNEVYSFIKYVKDNNVEILKSEEIVYNDITAGRFDLLCKRNDKIVRVDFKTTAKVHKHECGWQLSLYDDLDTVKADELEVWNFDDSGKLKVVPINFVSNDNINDLYNCERNGEKYVGKEIEVASIGDLEVIEEAMHIVENAKKEIKEAEERMKYINLAIIGAMISNNVKTFENDFIKITLVEPYERASVDSAKLKKEMPEIAFKYTKVSQVPASLKITLKEETDSE